MTLHEWLAYKSCREAYELTTGNTYEGIRILKIAKAEGSEKAAYNLNGFTNTIRTVSPQSSTQTCVAHHKHL